MTVVIVDVLEAVQVDEEDSYIVCTSSDGGEVLVKDSPVPEPGKGVVFGVVAGSGEHLTQLDVFRGMSD